MATNEFLTNFLKDAPADLVKAAAHLVTGREFSNATSAKEALRAVMHRPDAASAAGRMLDAYAKTALQDWCDDIDLPRSGNKDELIARIVAAYFDVEEEDEDEHVGSEEGDDDDDDAEDVYAVAASWTLTQILDTPSLKQLARAITGESANTQDDAAGLLFEAFEADEDAALFGQILQKLDASLVREACALWELDYTTKAAAVQELVETMLDPVVDEEDDGDDEAAPASALPTAADLARAFAQLPNPYAPRDYQLTAMAAARAARQPGRRYQVAIPTGGGKTMVGVDLAIEELKRGGKVLWLAPNWHLLYQAAREAGQRHGAYARGWLGRIGGAQKDLAALPERQGALRFTSLHTLGRPERLRDDLAAFNPSLVIWDECHYGVDAKMALTIKRALQKRGIPVLGLTATPKVDAGLGYELVYQVGFKDLVDWNHLATPVIVTPRSTGVTWTPRFRAGLGDITPESLRELSTNASRNRTIVEHWLANRDRLGKSIVFACDKAHADALEKLFRARGVEAFAIHSDYDNAENSSVLQRFKDGTVQVILGVAMLTLGIDVPDAQSVVLARPTHSDILYAQMIGRGARRTDTKTTFNIVEFTDNVDTHHAKLVSAATFFEGAGRRVMPAPTPSPGGESSGNGPRVIMQSPPPPEPRPERVVTSGGTSVFRTPPGPGGVTVGSGAANVQVRSQQADGGALTTMSPEPSGAAGTSPAPATNQCTACHADVGAFKFCPNCGTPVVRAPTHCAKCAAPWITGHKFCGECGASAPA